MGLVAVAMALSACATYHPLPLATRAPLASDLSIVKRRAGITDARLTVADVAFLAVLNSLSLRAARDQAGVARAQMLQAGLLHNPSLTGGSAFNLYAPAALTTAWTVGLSQGVVSIITRPARLASARAHIAAVSASLIWQEWQVIGKARLLAVDLIEANAQLRILEAKRDVVARLYRDTRRALALGNATLTTASPELSALTGVRTQIAALARQMAAWHQQLTALLGLNPEVPLRLARQPALPPLDTAAMRAALFALARHRPDLVALQLGYSAQEARVRGAILAQFPALVFGIQGGEDNTHDYSVGPQVTFGLPIFDRNQGQIAVARATRRQLHDEYTARLTDATGEVIAMLDDIALLRRQLAAVRAEQADAAPVARAAAAAFRAANLDARSYVDLLDVSLNLDLRRAQLRQLLLERQVAIGTLTGAGMPQLRRAGQGSRA